MIHSYIQPPSSPPPPIPLFHFLSFPLLSPPPHHHHRLPVNQTNLRWQVMQISHKSLGCKHPSKRAARCRHTWWHNDHLETNKQLHSTKAIAPFHKRCAPPSLSLSLFPLPSPICHKFILLHLHLTAGAGAGVTHKSLLLSNAIHFPRNTGRLLQKLGQA